MEAMLCRRMPYAPAVRPDCPLSHPSRSNPFLRRHLAAFPMGGARVAVARPRRIFAQAPPPSHLEKKDAKRGRAMGWSRTRGPVVGAAVVLGGALGAACLSHVGRASCSAQNPNTEMPKIFPADKSIKVLSGTFKRRTAKPREPPMLLELVVDQIWEEVWLLKQEPKNFRVLDLLVKHLKDQLAKEDCSLSEARGSDEDATSLLHNHWFELQDGPRKYNLGLLLIQTHINQRDYQKAKTICKHEHIRNFPGQDARPHLFLAIINMMLAVESMLEPKTKPEELKVLIDEAKQEWEKFREIYEKFRKPPPA